MLTRWPTAGKIAHDCNGSPRDFRAERLMQTPESLGSTTAYGINDAAEPLKDEDRSPVVIQIVALGCLNAHSHEGLGFRFCTCQKSKQSSQLGKAIHTQKPG